MFSNTAEKNNELKQLDFSKFEGATSCHCICMCSPCHVELLCLVYVGSLHIVYSGLVEVFL